MVFTRKRSERSDLFANLKGKGIEEGLEVPVAVMVPMVSMLWADQRKHEAETELIHSICSTSPIFLKPTHRQVEEWISAAEKIIHDSGGGDDKACRRAASALTKPLRQSAFAFAIQVMFADEKVTSDEKGETEKLANWLDVDQTTAGEIVRVISILRHGRDVR